MMLQDDDDVVLVLPLRFRDIFTSHPLKWLWGTRQWQRRHHVLLISSYVLPVGSDHQILWMREMSAKDSNSLRREWKIKVKLHINRNLSFIFKSTTFASVPMCQHFPFTIIIIIIIILWLIQVFIVQKPTTVNDWRLVGYMAYSSSSVCQCQTSALCTFAQNIKTGVIICCSSDFCSLTDFSLLLVH